MTPRKLYVTGSPESCLEPIQLARWAAGLLPEDEASRATRHISGCAACASQLRVVLGDETELSQAESRAIENLPSASPAGRRALAARMRGWRHIPRPWLLVAAIAGVTVGVGACYYVWQNSRPSSDQLVARAYSESRPFPYRLPAGGSPGQVRVARSASGLVDLPSATIEALSKTQQALTDNPSNPRLQLAAGQASLLAMDLNGARELLEQANRVRPSDNAMAASLATTLALQAERVGGNDASDLLQRALLVLDGCIQRSPQDVAARFNRALVLQRFGRDADAATELRRCLEDEHDPAWRAEIRRRLESLSSH